MRLVAGLFALTLTTSIALADQAKAPEPRAEQPRAKVALRVVRILPDSHQALLYDKQRGTHVLVDLGGSVAGYKVQHIDDDEVTLAAEGKEVVLPAPEPARRHRSPAKAPKAPVPAEITSTEPAATADKVIVAPVIIADENGVTTVINAEAAAAAGAMPTSVGPWTRGSVATPATKKQPAPAVETVDEAALPEEDPYFVVEPPTTTPYDEVEGEDEHPADPYTVPEGTATVTASAVEAGAIRTNPYDDPTISDDPYVAIEDEAEERAPAAPTVIARRDLDAALADFGTLTRSLRGSFSASGARLEQVAVGSVFAKAGLRAGDVVTAVDGRPVRSIDDAAELYVRAQTTRAANVQILRAGKPVTLKVQIR